MDETDKSIFKEYTGNINNLVSILYFILCLASFAIYVLCKMEIYNYPKHIAFIALVVDIICAILLRVLFFLKIPGNIYKYFVAFAIQIVVFLLSLDLNLQLSVTLILMPLLTFMYFDPVFTFCACIVSLISMLIGVCLCAEQAIVMFWPGVSPLQYILTTGGGRVLEFFIASILLIIAAAKARKFMLFVHQRNEKLSSLQNQMIYSFADIIESRDGTTGQHVKRTSQVVDLITSYLFSHHVYGEAIKEEDLHLITMAAPLHDIGKMKVPDAILSKPGKLTDIEFEIIKTHPIEGGKIIDRTLAQIEDPRYIKIAREMAVFHHEKWNGKGYPRGLAGEKIPLSARIMAIADVFDALCSNRSYKRAFSVDEAFKVLEESRNVHFESCLVDVMKALDLQLRAIYE